MAETSGISLVNADIIRRRVLERTEKKDQKKVEDLFFSAKNLDNDPYLSADEAQQVEQTLNYYHCSNGTICWPGKYSSQTVEKARNSDVALKIMDRLKNVDMVDFLKMQFIQRLLETGLDSMQIADLIGGTYRHFFHENKYMDINYVIKTAENLRESVKAIAQSYSITECPGLLIKIAENSNRSFARILHQIPKSVRAFKNHGFRWEEVRDYLGELAQYTGGIMENSLFHMPIVLDYFKSAGIENAPELLKTILIRTRINNGFVLQELPRFIEYFSGSNLDIQHEILICISRGKVSGAADILKSTPDAVTSLLKLNRFKNIYDALKFLRDIQPKAKGQTGQFLKELSERIDKGESLSAIMRDFQSYWKLNITWLTRFSKKTRAELVKNRQMNKPDGRRLAVLIYPIGDYNRAFEEPDLFDSLIKHGYKILYYEVETDKEMRQALIEASVYGKADVRIVAGHGTPKSIHFSDNNSYNEIYSYDTGDKVKMAGLAGLTLKKGAVIAHCACSSADNSQKTSLADMDSEIAPKVTVLGATETSFQCVPIFNKDNKIIGFEYGRNEKGQNIARKIAAAMP
ncbi:hypothetical protein A2276_03305 [candidate division WOR-1 bacterium RIFOXYA12_FULL_43_27]|uniref:DUF4347 domain-containing protein n=1 Tax=candidate division WOR-1 bacterium RIFOXYC2_FULL_46_14 TaxID=1802587 RepID=A0A1F4U7J0_UNCSA|nr:MAG: hypothetical protein A2276_03305 [candidate division WOR-1 bacterium RIFOXYA12_FULL_43_27]OGC19272.1 MAG: hypothetical protein A2292_01030 [candidate division WOR-1 bacterium RIFOXYB2_FULL_46_45]OGC30261.1 MAG: hypothetical protein A2232_01030 [candidate division WOR-1 bacterium RIFOXYA2_FULL_46_56]OGC40862.1 MAG: hypothetical protein A2438_01030 [candidate division WOR-1 bacterium RIFOXYC2_FULL_46_14]